MPLSCISLFMNDFVSIFLKDISSIVDTLIEKLIIDKSFDNGTV